MKADFQIFFSNKAEQLLQNFKERIYAPPSSPFTRRFIIVSSPAVKSWLMMQLAKDPALGIAAGLEINYLEETIEKLRSEFPLTTLSPKKLPSLLEMGLAIEILIRKAASQFRQLSLDEQSFWQPLFQYLQIQHHEHISKKSERRLVALASKLALLFKQYGKYGYKMISEWDQTASLEWQQTLWQQLFHKNTPWTYLYRELNDDIHLDSKSFDLQIHLFSISYIPPLLHRYLEKYANFFPLKYYLLSPCQYFWSDICSDKEIHRLSSYWKCKGVSGREQMELEEFLRDRNPLLANFGRLGREMAQLMENSSAISFDGYSLPQSINEYPQLESIVDCTTTLIPATVPLTLLQAVQADMLLLRNPVKDSKLSFDKFDGSVQIHSSCTKLREIQALHDLLIGILSKHRLDANPIRPEDIIIMAPDITEYESFITMVFQNAESKIDIHIMDLHMPSKNLLVQGFLHLLSLPLSRWDAITLLQLFEYTAFQQKQQWEQEDIVQIRLWIRNAGIRWGANGQHRNELLERDHCLNIMSEQSSLNTWEDGFGRLLTELAMEASDDEEEADIKRLAKPLNISASQSDLLGKLLKLLNSLRIDLKPMSDGSMLTLNEWSSYLQCINEAYFYIDSKGSDEDQGVLEEAFYTLKKTAKYFFQEKFSFTSIKKQLQILLSHQKTNYRESRLSAATFCSLLPLRTIPAKVIVLLGLQEGSYPRMDHTIPFNLMKGNSKADYFPSQTDFDRYLFLEALLSARQYFIMSYLGYSQIDFKEQGPSLLVTEMLNYFDNSYVVQGELPSKKCRFKHPFQDFDCSYFAKESPLRSFSKVRYQAAIAHYRLDKSDAYRFIPTFHIQSPKDPVGDICLNLSDLSAYAKNPLKTYFNKKLGIYLSKEEDSVIENEESLLLSYLELDGLKKASLKKPLEEIIHLAHKKRLLAPGMFKDVSIETLKEKIDELKSNLDAVEVNPQELFEIEFSERYTVPQKTSQGHWQLPPLKINYKDAITVKIIGRLKDVAPQGLVAHIKDDKDVCKSWPQFLVFHTLVKEHALSLQTQMIFAKSGMCKQSITDNPHHDLNQYLEYYFTGLEHPSPLIPEWIPIILKEDGQILMDKLEAFLKDSYNSTHNDYLDWLMDHSSISDSILAWKKVSQRLFGPMMNEWFKNKKTK